MLGNQLRAKAIFKSEADLCRAFMTQLPPEWTAYPETAGFDILLSRNADGVQVGIEAKLKLNAEVINQIAEGKLSRYGKEVGPDFRAVLIPWGCTSGLMSVCKRIGVTVIQMRDRELYLESRNRYGFIDRSVKKFDPPLPSVTDTYWGDLGTWFDFAPANRETLPAYVPDVAAGRPSPVQLSEWKIKAIKICILLERRGYVTKSDFAHIDIDHRRWMPGQMGWLAQDPENKGRYVPGRFAMDLRKQHPTNYAQIDADFEKWKPADKAGLL